MKRGDIYWVNLNPTIGSEIKKVRPCVLVGATPINNIRRTVLVVPLSTSARVSPPLTISVTCLGKQVVAACDQLRAVDKQRLVNPAGTLALHDLMDLDSALKQVLALR